MPGPIDTARALAALAQTELLDSIASSLRRVGVGFALATLVAVPVGMLLGLSEPARRALDPLVELIRPISAIAWIPMAIIWFGVSEQAAYFLIAYAAFFPIFLNTVAGVRGVERLYVDAATVLGAPRRMLIGEVLLPAAMPSILAGLRVGLGIAIAVIVAAELGIGFTLGSGLGYLLLKYSFLLYAPANLLAVMAVIGILGLAADRVLQAINRRLAPWSVGR
ncbi:MAG: ABC transporter permease [Chloroflexota bacterium]|nr:ABC transporter permease [Chloroflexota bacterium]